MWFLFLCLIDLKLLSNDIEHLRNIKDEVGLKKKQLDEASNRMNVNRDQIDKYDRKLGPITERLNMISAREADITKLYTEKGMCIYVYIYLPVEFINVSS
jgi:chromosome segregation ATPase